MKPLIAILIVLAVIFVGWRVFDYYGQVNRGGGPGSNPESNTPITEDRLNGLPYQLESKLREAKAAGPAVFKQFIDSLKNYPDVKDPRLAWIELDYVVMIGGTDPIQAKKIFAEVKKRTPANSPIYPRIQALAKTYD